MEKRLLLQNCALFDGETSRAGDRFTVIIEDGRIVDVCTQGGSGREGDIIVDIGGRTLMPGLIDAHFHCNSPSLDVASIDRLHASYLAQLARRHLEETLLRGFTTVRDAGGADRGLVNAIAEGLVAGPHLLICGKALSQTGGHGDLRHNGPVDPCGCSYKGALAIVVDGADAVRAAVREELRNGADHIKLFVSGGVFSPSDPIWMDQFTDEEISAAVCEAGSRKTYVMAHAHTSEAAVRCARLGVRSIEHGTMIDGSAARIIAELEAYVVPTLTVMDSILEGAVEIPPYAAAKLESLRETAVRAVENCMAAGVKLGLGTDLFGALHGREQMELIARAKVSGSLESLRSATSINAEILGRKGEIGVIRKGARADLIVIAGDPVRDIELFRDPERNVVLVMKAGAIIKNRLPVARRPVHE